MQRILWGVEVMTIVMNVLYRYVAPFLMGVCMAATTVVSDIASTVPLFAAAGVFGFFSFPAARRMLARRSDVVV